MMESKLLPEHQAASDAKDTKAIDKIAHDILPRLLEMPEQMEDVLNDIQRLIENLRSTVKATGVKAIGLASAIPGEGASTIATMISLMAAGARQEETKPLVLDNVTAAVITEKPNQREHGILLIDAQVRRPALHKIFGVPIEHGLCEFLLHGLSPQTLMKEIPAADMKLITVGQRWRTPFTPIDTEKLKALLQEVKSDFEFVFVDIPPLLHSTEGVTVSKLCDGLLLVVRAHQTRWEIVKEARRLLEKSGVNILGAVLNRRQFYIPEKIYNLL